jgi:hypothetical protein
VWRDLNIDDFKSKSPDCTCASSPFICNPTGHVITGDLKIINTYLREVLAKGPKYREPKSINWKHNFKILMDSVENYARQWTKREKEDLETLSEWMRSVRSLIQIIIFFKISGSMGTRSTSIFKDPNVVRHMSLFHDKYVIVSVDKAPNNIVFVCKSHYIDCLIKELGIDNSLGNPTYTR